MCSDINVTELIISIYAITIHRCSLFLYINYFYEKMLTFNENSTSVPPPVPIVPIYMRHTPLPPLTAILLMVKNKNDENPSFQPESIYISNYRYLSPQVLGCGSCSNTPDQFFDFKNTTREERSKKKGKIPRIVSSIDHL